MEAVLSDVFRRPREFYATLVESTSDAVVVTDGEERVLLWNSAAERMFGYTLDEVSGNGIGFDERHLDNSVSSGGMWHQVPLRSAGSSTIRSTPSDRPASSSWSLVILWLKIR